MKTLFIKCCILVFKLPLPLALRNFLMWPIASRVLGKEYSEILNLRAGFQMHAYMGDHLGREMIFYGTERKYFWEPSTVRLVEHLARDAKCAIVAGSHIGLLAIHIQRAMGKLGKTYTFEPHPKLAQIAKANFALNEHKENIRLVPVALGQYEGNVELVLDGLRSHVTDTSSAHEKSTLEKSNIPQTTIDSFVTSEQVGPVDLILLDVEGAEYSALRGGLSTIEKSKTKDIIFEISHPSMGGFEKAKKIFDLLCDKGYHHYVIEETYDANEKQNKDAVSLASINDVYMLHQFDSLRYYNMIATKRDPQNLKELGITIR